MESTKVQPSKSFPVCGTLLVMYILFYSTFVCPTEIMAFSDSAEKFKKINTEIVACSVDSKYTHLAWYAYTYVHM